MSSSFSVPMEAIVVSTLRKEGSVNSAVNEVVEKVAQTRSEWGWYLASGIALAAIGIFAMISGYSGTRASVILIGALLAAAGIIQLVTAFRARGAGHIVLYFLVGALDLVVGVMLVEHPDDGALALTLLLALAFVAGGLFRFFAANLMQFPHYGWVAFSGILTFLLGIFLWAQWPVSAEWFIGFAVGLNFLIAGIALSAVSWKLHERL